MLKPIEPKPERVNTGIRLPVALYGRVQVEARRRGLSVNRLVEWVLENWLNAGRHPPQ